ncbi:MAG: hypothetical protein H7175_24995 [Burkholderiales bacterium]|nr:hypothetical protein [Anaerolineae bacterium]
MCCIFIFILTGCSTPPISEPPTSTWGEIFTLDYAEQTDAPAIQPDISGLSALWIGADETGVHQDLRRWSSAGLSERIVLPLPPVHPYAQQVALSQSGIHILWLDAEGTSAGSETHLFSALVQPEAADGTLGTILRGPTLISDSRTFRYAYAPNSDGSLWVVWSGGPLDEPVLYVQSIDNEGRPRPSQRLLSDADWPVLMTDTDGAQILFWWQPSSNRIYRAWLDEGELFNTQPITTAPNLNPGDRADTFTAGRDQTNGYLFWNITRLSGQHETLFASGELSAPQWSTPTQLGLQLAEGETLTTGFNGGEAQAARPGEDWLSWSAPLTNAAAFELLPVAAMIGSNLSVVYMEGGEIVGYQAVVPVTLLLGTPALTTDRDQHLYLAWSEPQDNGTSALRLTTTHSS